MKLFRRLTRSQFNALPPEAKKAYRRDMAENDIRFNSDRDWSAERYCISLDGLPYSGDTRPETANQRAIIREILDEVRAAISAERAALSIPDGAYENKLWCSVAKAGKRWAWCADLSWIEDRGALPETPFGFSDTEEGAWRDVEASALEYIFKCAGVNINETIHGEKRLGVVFGLVAAGSRGATKRVRELNKAVRAAKPGKGGKGASPTRYVVTDHRIYGFRDNDVHLHRIVKETPKQIHFETAPFCYLDETPVTGNYRLGNKHIGIIRKDKVKNGCVYYTGGDLYHERVYISLEAFNENEARIAAEDAESARAATDNLAELKQKMVDAHPDKGGTHEAFIIARQEYEKAARRVKRVA